jgi:hypothetical protein
MKLPPLNSIRRLSGAKSPTLVSLSIVAYSEEARDSTRGGLEGVLTCLGMSRGRGASTGGIGKGGSESNCVGLDGKVGMNGNSLDNGRILRSQLVLVHVRFFFNPIIPIPSLTKNLNHPKKFEVQRTVFPV